MAAALRWALTLCRQQALPFVLGRSLEARAWREAATKLVRAQGDVLGGLLQVEDSWRRLTFTV